MRLTPFPQRSCKCFRTEHVTPNELVWGNVKNKMNYITITESYFSEIILHFIPTSYSNTTTPQSQATVVKLKPLRLLPGNLFDMECIRRYLATSTTVTLLNEARPHDNI
jgi:hypothetical protein